MATSLLCSPVRLIRLANLCSSACVRSGQKLYSTLYTPDTVPAPGYFTRGYFYTQVSIIIYYVRAGPTSKLNLVESIRSALNVSLQEDPSARTCIDVVIHGMNVHGVF